MNRQEVALKILTSLISLGWADHKVGNITYPIAVAESYKLADEFLKYEAGSNIDFEELIQLCKNKINIDNDDKYDILDYIQTYMSVNQEVAYAFWNRHLEDYYQKGQQ